MQNGFDYPKYIKILGLVLGTALLVLVLSSVLLTVGDATSGPAEALVSGSIFTALASCIVSALSLVAMGVLWALAKRAGRRSQAPSPHPNDPPR